MVPGRSPGTIQANPPQGGRAVNKDFEEGRRKMRRRGFSLPFAAGVVATSAFVLGSVAVAADSGPSPFDDAIQATSVSFGGAQPLPTSRTVQHWIGESTNPIDGITYRYNVVGADPADDGSASIGVDIIPLDVIVDGRSFNGSERVDGVLGSPIFRQDVDYSWTRAITRPDGTRWYRPSPLSPFPLSSGNTGQMLDVIMRSQFNKVTSGYHLLLGTPRVYDPVTIDVPDSKGTLLISPVGVAGADVDVGWFQARIQNLTGKLHLDPTRLAIFLSKDVVLFRDNNPAHCCAAGGHGAGHVTGGFNGPGEGNGNQPVQTFVWSSWFSPGLFGPRLWINKDVRGLTDEILEWANDPFANNTVMPWKADNAPQYGCNELLEVADPATGLGFAMGGNVYDPALLPNGTQNPFADGMFHLPEIAFIPWFMHSEPNTLSQPAQATAGARYTFMGDLNGFSWFHRPADTCNP